MNKKLSELEIGNKATVLSLNDYGNIRRRLLDIGLIEGTEVECVLKSPFLDPVAYFIRGAVIALRKEDADNIIVEVHA